MNFPSPARFPDVPVAPTWQSRRGRSRSSNGPKAPEDYFRTALSILAESGAESLTTGRLCERLAITKGSFYYHFDGMDDFILGFADYRESQLETRLAAVADRTDPYDRLGAMITLLSRLPHEAEAAVRAWSRSQSALASSQERIDYAVTSILEATVHEALGDETKSAWIAHTTIALVSGMQQVERPIDRLHMARTLARFVATCTALEAWIDHRADGRHTVKFGAVGQSRNPAPAPVPDPMLTPGGNRGNADATTPPERDGTT